MKQDILWRHRTVWHKSYVQKILSNKAVTGEFQPHLKREGKRLPTGDPIKQYYPAIIDETLFYRAQVSTQSRRKIGGGRKGRGFAYLFKGLLLSDDKKFPNRRKVTWAQHLPRTSFSQNALFEIGSAVTLFQIKNFDEEFVLALRSKTD
jgi:Recombinase